MRKPEAGARRIGSQLLEAALHSAVGAIIVIDDGGTMLSVNPAVERVFGFAERELIGQNVNILMPEPYRSRHDGYLRHHLETGERKIIGIGREVMARRKGGAIFPVHLSVSAFEEDGRRYFTGIVHDLSARPGADVLREQVLLHAILNQLPDALLIVDPANRITLCNPAVTRVFGYTPEHLIGQTLAVLCGGPSELAKLAALTEGVAREESPEPVTLNLRRKSGEGFPAEIVASVLRDDGGHVQGFLLLNRDISRQVVQDEALRKSQRMEAIGQLTGGIAHDFNNLLTIITGNHELLEMELADKGQRELLAEANEAALMGARLTNRLLTFARRRRLEPVELDLNDQVLSMAELLRRTLGEAIELGTLLAPGLWPVRADPSGIENAVLNLAINARDAMPTGGKLVLETNNVVLHERDVASEIGVAPGEYVCLSVSDTGSGMAKEVVGRVFEPFFTTKEPGRGTGLGLSVIYGFVKQSGGRVTVYSEPGRGTTINVYLPRIAAASADKERAAAAAPPPASVRGETVLLVEDSPRVRKMTARRLRNFGYEVVQVEDAKGALDVLRSGRKVDLVFSDVVMPGTMSGFGLARWIKENMPASSVLLTSGFAEDVARAGEAPDPELRILRKPYTGSELARALRRAIDGGR